MITRQEAIAELRLNFEEPLPESIALVLSYLQAGYLLEEE